MQGKLSLTWKTLVTAMVMRRMRWMRGMTLSSLRMRKARSALATTVKRRRGLRTKNSPLDHTITSGIRN